MRHVMWRTAKYFVVSSFKFPSHGTHAPQKLSDVDKEDLIVNWRASIRLADTTAKLHGTQLWPLTVAFLQRHAVAICDAVLSSPSDTKTSFIASLHQEMKHGGCEQRRIRRFSIPHSTGHTRISEAGTVLGEIVRE